MIGLFHELTFIFPLSQILTLLLGPLFGQKENSVAGCFIAAFVVIFLLVMKYLSKRNRLLLGGAFLTLLIGMLLVIGEEKRDLIFSEWKMMALCAGFCAVALVLGVFSVKVNPVRRVLCAGVILGGLLMAIFKTEVSEYAVMMMFLIVLAGLLTEVQLYWKKSGYTDMGTHVATLLPMLILTVSFILIFKIPKEPCSWKVARQIFSNISSQVERMVGELGHRTDEYQPIGFFPNSSFAAHFENAGEPKEVMTVRFYIGNSDTVYMAGKFFNSFTKDGWEYVSNTKEKNMLFEALETKCASSKAENGDGYDYIQKEKNEIETLFYNTRYLFSPSPVCPDSFRSIEYVQNGSERLAVKKLRKGTVYSSSYYRMNYNNPYFSHLVSEAPKIEEGEWKKACNDLGVLGDKRFSFSEYEKYRAGIKEEYLLKEGVSSDVKDLLNSILAGETDAYQKMKRIEAYLSSMNYTLTVEKMPGYVEDSESFLDYFLFESKEGYCVHFATAFVLLARECGLPARYVQGYRVEKKGSQTVTVTEADAHAWPEVYFENFGWVSFEPTPGLSVPAGWDISKRYEGITLNPNYVVMPTETEEVTDEPLKEKAKIDIKLIIVPAISVLVFVIIFLAVSTVISERKYRKLQDSEKVNYLVSKIFRMLKRLGYPIFEYETLSEYQKKISPFTEENEIPEVCGAISSYEKILYSKGETSKETVIDCKAAYDKLKKLVKRRNILKAFF